MASELPSATPAPATKSATGASVALFVAAVLVAVAAATWLFKSNPAAGNWAQGYDPMGTWWVSTIFAALPIVVLLGAMAVLRLKAHVAACAGLITALAVAMLVFHI